METLITIREKLEKFLSDVNSDNNITINAAIAKFKSLFTGEYEKKAESDVEPYYNFYSQTFYIKNGYGIGLQKSWGSGDVFGSSSSHKGVDLALISPLADQNIYLWDESERNVKTADINVLFAFDPSISSLQKRLLDSSLFQSVYPFLPIDIRNHDSFAPALYNSLWYSAELDHSRDVEADRGGQDVTIYDAEEYLLDSLCTFEDNTSFLQIAVPLFVVDYPGYLDRQIADCEHALYMIQHKDMFYMLASAQKACYTDSLKQDETMEKLQFLKTEIAQEEAKLSALYQAEKKYQQKKYSIVSLFKGEPFRDRRTVNAIIADKEIVNSQITTLKEELSMGQKTLEKLKKSISEENNKTGIIEARLDYPYKNFEVDSDFLAYEPYIEGKYFMDENIDRLVQQEGKYNERMRQLSMLKSYDTDSPSEKLIKRAEAIEQTSITKDYEKSCKSVMEVKQKEKAMAVPHTDR